MENILITGGAGFIGSHLTDALLAKGYSVVIVDDLSTGSLDNLPLKNEQLTVYERTITDREFIDELFDKYSFNYIFHYAAVASVQKSVEEPAATHAVNFDSTLGLLEAARKLPSLKRFVFVSSAAVYGDKPTLPCSEEDCVNPISPYGVDKYASERYVLNAASLYGVPGTAMRYFNVYGARQNPSSPYSGVLSIFTDEFSVSKSPKLTIFGDGKQTRDFIYIKDVIKANLLLMEDERGIGKVFNVGTGCESSLIEIIAALEEVFGKSAEVQYEVERKGDIKRSFANIDRIRSIGFKVDYRMEEGLKEYRDWLDK